MSQNNPFLSPLSGLRVHIPSAAAHDVCTWRSAALYYISVLDAALWVWEPPHPRQIRTDCILIQAIDFDLIWLCCELSWFFALLSLHRVKSPSPEFTFKLTITRSQLYSPPNAAHPHVIIPQHAVIYWPLLETRPSCCTVNNSALGWNDVGELSLLGERVFEW